MSKKKYTKWIGDDDYCDYVPSHYPPPPKEEEYPSQLRHSYTDPGVIMGLPRDHTSNYIGMSNGSDGHIAVIGGSGSGKTSGIGKPTMKTWSAPMVVTDIKGELSEFYGKLFENGLVKRPYLVFNPMQIDGPSYDALWWIMADDEVNLINNINEIALAIVPDIPNNINKYWDDCERKFLSAGLLYCFLMGLSFSEAMCKIASETLSELCKQLAKCSDVRIKIILGDISKLKPEHFASIDSGLRNKILIFVTDPHIAHAFRGIREGAVCFSWDDLEEYNIFIRIPEGRIEQWGAVVNLMYTQLIRCLERRPEKYSSAGADSLPILLLMDEFARFGKLELLPNAISTLRSKNVNICLMMQSLAQLDKIYGTYDRRIILDNCSYKAILGANDPETQKDLSELIGTTKVFQKSYSEHFDDDKDTTGYSTQISESREQKVFSNELSYLNDVVLLSPYGVHRIEKYQQYDISDELYKTNADTITIKGTAISFEEFSKKNTHVLVFKGTAKLVEPKKEPHSFKNTEVVKMLTVDERLENANKRFEDAENQSEISIGKELDTFKNSDIGKFCAIGECVFKYFPKVMDLYPGKTRNEISPNLVPLDAFLSALSVETEFLYKVSEKIHLNELMVEANAFPSECVDGQ